MESKNFNSLLIKAIQNKIPEETKIYKFLMDTLIIGKEPAYRRIRNEVPFTFEEVIKISSTLGISIDNIVQQKLNNDTIVQFSMPLQLINSDIETKYFNCFDNMVERLKQINHPSLEILIGLNRMPYAFTRFETLAKYEYFRFLHATNAISINTHFDDITVPANITNKQKQLASYIAQLSNITCVLDKTILSNSIEEMTYFFNGSFLSKENILTIQQELYQLLNTLLSIPDNKTGIISNNQYSKWKFYISDLSIDTNICHYEVGEEFSDIFFMHQESPLTIDNSQLISSLNKRWFSSRLKFSILISNSNVIGFASMYRSFKESIDNMSLL